MYFFEVRKKAEDFYIKNDQNKSITIFSLGYPRGSALKKW
jgi:hypothetical protein